MFIAIATVTPEGSYNELEVVGKGPTLKAAYDALKEQAAEAEAEPFEDADIDFFEAEKIQVEFQITRKEVVTATPRAAKVAAPRPAPRVNK